MKYVNLILSVMVGYLITDFAIASYYSPPRSITFPMRQPGEVITWGGGSCPTGTVALDGSSLARSGTYANLFAVLSTTYGAADGSHFNVPNAQGVFIRGSGSQTISALTHTGTRGTTQASNFASHRHRGWGSTGGTVGALAVSNACAMGALVGTCSGATYVDILAGTSHQVLENTGSGSETYPANISLLYCIVY